MDASPVAGWHCVAYRGIALAPSMTSTQPPQELAYRGIAPAPSMASTQPPQELAATHADAGKAFVLESKGNWLHAGYHLTSATAGPPLLTLPFAMASLGWAPGICTLLLAAAVTFYACFLLSITTEELNARGFQCFRFWDVASCVMGPTLAHYFVAPLQYLVCYIVVIALILLGGETLEAVFRTTLSNGGHLRLYYYTAIFGALALVLSQIPSFHSLRFFNLLSMLLCLGFSICTVGGSIIAGISAEAPPKDYSIHGSPVHVLFGTFNAVSIMITAFANPMIVEIQATLVPPPTGKMLKGLLVCYSVSLLTFLSVAISGYWAFGSSAQGIVFDNMESLVPKWLYVLPNAFACLQLIVATVVYLQPLFAKYEGLVINVNAGRFSPRSVILRLAGRSVFVVIAILIAAMLPFFADFSAFMGAFGFVPLCIVLPSVFYSSVFRDKVSQRHLLHAVNIIIIVLFSVATIIGTVAAVRQIVLDVGKYRIFSSS